MRRKAEFAENKLVKITKYDLTRFMIKTATDDEILTQKRGDNPKDNQGDNRRDNRQTLTK